MNRYHRWIAGFAATIAAGAIALPNAKAVQLADGTVAFVQPPSLAYAGTTNNTAASSAVRYYFTIEVPETAGEPLQTVSIHQRDSSSAVREVHYDLEDTFAFVGTRRDRGDEIGISDVVYDNDTQTVSVTFDPPVPPGTTVTLALEPERNPRMEGVYLFGVTVFPEGEQTQGQFLGFGRIHIYMNGDSLIFN